MLQQGSAVWAAAGGAAIVAAGAAALYWTRPAFLWPNPNPAVVATSAQESPAALPASPAPAAVNSKSALASAAATPEGVRPAFDVVNVEPTGEAVIAGRAAPNANVELRDRGKAVAEAKTDSTGQFVIIPPPLAPGDHSLSLATGTGASEVETSGAIAVEVPAPPARAALAPASTGPATSPPSPAAPKGRAAATPAPDASARIAIRSVEAGGDGRLAAKGAAGPNAVVRLYLNDAFVADAKTKSDGRWSLTIEHGMTPGAYALRADEIDPSDAKVVARAEAPFNYTAPSAAAAANAPPAPVVASAAPATEAPSQQSTADAVVASVQTHQVLPGHTLWGISQKFYGDGSRYRLIFAANTSQIRDPHWIYPGQTFVVPKPEPKL